MGDDVREIYAVQIATGLMHDVILVGLAVPIIAYVVARWRLYHEKQPHDPHLGLKVALSMFRLTAYQIALAGAFLLIYSMMSDLPDAAKSPMTRTALGILVPSLLVWGAHAIAMQRTNAAQLPHVAR